MKKLTGTIKQAHEASGLSVRKIYDHLARGDFDSVLVGRRRLIVWESFERFLLDKAKTYAPVAAVGRRTSSSSCPEAE